MPSLASLARVAGEILAGEINRYARFPPTKLLILVDPVNDRKLGDTIKLPRIIRDQRHAQA